MEGITHFFVELADTLRHLGVWGYWIIFLIAFADSLIVVGTFTTGMAFLIFAGVLVSQGVYTLANMALFAASGAILGGFASYLLGRFGSEFFHHEAPHKKQRYEHGAELLERYEGASILVGRFLGPVGSVVAFIAGFIRMPLKSFLLWNVFSGLVWAVLYVFVGHFLGDSLRWLERLG